MNFVGKWFREQNHNKKFWILEGIACLITVLLCVEFYLLQYELLKVLRYLALLWGLFLIAWIDGQSRRIPNRILIFLLAVRSGILLVECFYYHEFWMVILISAVSGFIFGGGMFLFCYFLTRGGIGAGDVKLFAVLGYYQGSRMIFSTIFLAVLFSAIFSILMLLIRRIGLKEELPFAPFALAGTIMAMALGM